MATKSGKVGTEGAFADNLSELNEKIRQLQAIMPGSDGGGSVQIPFKIGELILNELTVRKLRRLIDPLAEDPLYLTETDFLLAYPGANCEAERLYEIGGFPVMGPRGTFLAGWEATHAFQNPAATPVDLADGYGDFVVEGAGTSVPVAVTNTSCFPIEILGGAYMAVNWNQSAGCAMTWGLEAWDEDGLVGGGALWGTTSGNNTDPGEVEQAGFFIPLGQVAAGATRTFTLHPFVDVAGATFADEVIALTAAMRIFGGSAT